jgi:excisionase family DNA binding protein
MAIMERERGAAISPPILNEKEAELAKAAQRCIMAALDHSRAASIKLVDERGRQGEPAIKLPPKALRLMAQVLGAMGERRPIMLIPQKHELTTMEAAHFLNVSRPFVIKEIEAGRIKHSKVGTHRRIAYDDLMAYRKSMQERQDKALQVLADEAQALGLY